MEKPIPPSLETAYAECQKLAFSHYENFPVASLLLPKETRPHVAALYAFARTADDFADEPPSGGMTGPANGPKVRAWRSRQMDQWERSFKNALKGKSAPPVLQAFAHTLKTFRIPEKLPLDLLRAFRMDIVKHRWSTWNSVLYYCRHSADPVGRMVLYIHGIRDPKLHAYSDFICSGLQLINFWQDTTIDLERGRLYYPKEALKKAGVREKDLMEGKDSPAVRALVKDAVDLTQAHFEKGRPLLDAVSGRLKLELRATFLGGQAILNKVRALDYNVLRERPALGTFDKVTLGLRALFS